MTSRLHHVGMVVAKLEPYLDESSVWTLVGEVVEDPIQKARLCLVTLGDARDGALVELVEPQGEDSRVYAALERGEKQHHVCYQVDSRDEADALVRSARMLPVTDWEPAVLFGGSPVRFAYTRTRELLEFYVDESR